MIAVVVKLPVPELLQSRCEAGSNGRLTNRSCVEVRAIVAGQRLGNRHDQIGLRDDDWGAREVRRRQDYLTSNLAGEIPFDDFLGAARPAPLHAPVAGIVST